MHIFLSKTCKHAKILHKCSIFKIFAKKPHIYKSYSIRYLICSRFLGPCCASTFQGLWGLTLHHSVAQLGCGVILHSYMPFCWVASCSLLGWSFLITGLALWVYDTFLYLFWHDCECKAFNICVVIWTVLWLAPMQMGLICMRKGCQVFTHFPLKSTSILSLDWTHACAEIMHYSHHHDHLNKNRRRLMRVKTLKRQECSRGSWSFPMTNTSWGHEYTVWPVETTENCLDCDLVWPISQ